jgi:hypothetical protein
MADKPTPEEIALWQRRLASQANNRAWTLTEVRHRTADDDEEMLQAAHAAMYLWRMVGNPSNHAHAAQLLAHVYALLKLPAPASHYLGKASPHFERGDVAPWELAFFHAVAANVAFAAGHVSAHAGHYAQAQAAAEHIADPQTRDMFASTLRVIPMPAS